MAERPAELYLSITRLWEAPRTLSPCGRVSPALLITHRCPAQAQSWRGRKEQLSRNGTAETMENAEPSERCTLGKGKIVIKTRKKGSQELQFSLHTIRFFWILACLNTHGCLLYRDSGVRISPGHRWCVSTKYFGPVKFKERG